MARYAGVATEHFFGAMFWPGVAAAAIYVLFRREREARKNLTEILEEVCREVDRLTAEAAELRRDLAEAKLKLDTQNRTTREDVESVRHALAKIASKVGAEAAPDPLAATAAALAQAMTTRTPK